MADLIFKVCVSDLFMAAVVAQNQDDGIV
jgi:hypothetical protein